MLSSSMVQRLPFDGRFDDSADLMARGDCDVFLERLDRNETDEGTGLR
jgi:hypothetical protein